MSTLSQEGGSKVVTAFAIAQQRHSGSCDFAVDSKSENSRKRRIWRSSSHGGGQLSQCLKKVRAQANS